MKLNHNKTPYFDALLKYVKDNIIPFHCPGHKMGEGILDEFKNFLGNNLFSIDLNEVPGIDNFHFPVSNLKESFELVADLWQSDYSYFLVNGTTSGNHAMLFSILNPYDKIIIPRTAHKSVFGALILSGAIPVFAIPEFDYNLQIDHNITYEHIYQLLQKNPDVKGVLIEHPTYYGATSNLGKLQELIHGNNKILLVDEAWGGHFHFNDKLPVSATSIKADLVVNSTHKILSSLSQTSYLHLNEGRVDKDKLEFSLHLFTTTSPNCVLMASLDIARKQMALYGKDITDKMIKLSEYARYELNQIPGIYVVGEEIIGKPGVYNLDLTKLVITAKELGLTGYDVFNILRQNYNIQLELADLYNTIALITVGTTKEHIDLLIKAFNHLSKNYKNYKSDVSKILNKKDTILPDWPKLKLRPRDAITSKSEIINLDQANSRISTEIITTYPPGIPIISPGEVFTKDIIDYINIEIKAGSKITGVVDLKERKVRVVK